MTEVSAAPDSAVEEVEQARQRLRHSARAAMGVTGEGATPSFRSVLSRPGVSAYPLAALGLLAIVDQFQSYGVAVLGPEISRDVGTSRSTLALLIALTAVAATGASLPMAALVARRPRRALVAIITAFAWALTTLFTGFVTSTLALAAVLILDGVSSASVFTVHTPLLIDCYPPDVRVRVLGGYRAIGQASAVVAPAVVGMLTAWGDLTWRGVFLVMGLMALTGAAFSVRLRDPGFGRWDAARLVEVVRTDAGTGPAEVTAGDDEEEVPLRTGEIARRLLAVPTLRRLYAALAVLGMFIFPLGTFISFFLDEEWGLGPTGRSVFFAVMPLFSIAVIVAYARRAESLFRQEPARLVRVGAVFFAASTVFTVISVFSPTFPLMVGFYAIHAGFVGFLLPAFSVASLGITPPRLRPHATALGGIFVAGVGGVSGSLLLGGLDRRYGTPVAVAVLAIPGLAAAALLYRAAATVDADLDRTVDDLVDAEEVRAVRAKGGRLPLLSCHKVDFAYDKTQVLFGVDLSVEEGELLALLGTNGAGKSTLLRVLAGLGFPSSGTVRLEGRDVTFVDPERRLEMGVLFIPSGRSVFRSLSVTENLNVFGYVHGRNRAAVAAGVEASFEAFPALHANRHRRAGVLSGGQQQMLGLAQAFIVRPRVLLVDELSLGLAPSVVTELLASVRRLNGEGTTVVLVEQSVTTALQVASRAVFMEKGCIRFDGDPQQLWERPDLLRPVFLSTPGAETAP